MLGFYENLLILIPTIVAYVCRMYNFWIFLRFSAGLPAKTAFFANMSCIYICQNMSLWWFRNFLIFWWWALRCFCEVHPNLQLKNSSSKLVQPWLPLKYLVLAEKWPHQVIGCFFSFLFLIGQTWWHYGHLVYPELESLKVPISEQLYVAMLLLT